MINEAESFADVISQNAEALEEVLFKSIQESLYSNKMMVAPRRLKKIVQDEARGLSDFLTEHDPSQVQERGRHLAEAGLGHRAIVNMTTAMRMTTWKWANPYVDNLETVSTIEAYTSALMEGYMSGFEAALQREQQRTHEAYQRAYHQ